MPSPLQLTLDPQSEQFIAEQLAAGRYSSANETVCAALRLLAEREQTLSALRQALIDGENSGPASYTLEALIAELDQGTPH